MYPHACLNKLFLSLMPNNISLSLWSSVQLEKRLSNKRLKPKKGRQNKGRQVHTPYNHFEIQIYPYPACYLFSYDVVLIACSYFLSKKEDEQRSFTICSRR